MRRRVLPLLALVLAVAAAPAFAAEPQASLPDIEDEVMCVVCGVVLEHAIDAPQAIQERDTIRRLINQGLTKDEIKDALVAEYGSEVLSVPDTEGFDLAAWLVPGVAIVVAGGAILVALRRWRRAGRGARDSDPAQDLDAAETERLDEDLARYEL